jgi:DNA-binding NtrC family response regulator
VVRVPVPALRERPEDIPVLVQHFIDQFAGRHGNAGELGARVIEGFQSMAWPGNVRELRNVMRRAVVLCDGPEIAMEHLFVASSRPRRSTGLPPVESSAWASTAPAVPVRPPRPPASDDDPQRREILDALERFAGNQTKVARHLGISRTTLSARLDAYGIARPKKQR